MKLRGPLRSRSVVAVIAAYKALAAAYISEALETGCNRGFGPVSPAEMTPEYIAEWVQDQLEADTDGCIYDEALRALKEEYAGWDIHAAPTSVS